MTTREAIAEVGPEALLAALIDRAIEDAPEELEESEQPDAESILAALIDGAIERAEGQEGGEDE